MRDIKTINEELRVAEAALKEASGKRDDLRRELRAAQVEAAKEKGHPWLGKKVKRTVPNSFGRTTTTQKGTLTIYDPMAPEHRGLRGMYRMEPGELFVISASGKTGYNFFTPEPIAASSWLSRQEKHPWELAE